MHYGFRAGFRVGKWTVDPELGDITSEDETVTLKPRLMELLVYLAEHAGDVLSKEHLLDTLWKDTFVAENALMNAVSELRKALGDDRKDPTFITTHSKRGYRLIAPVSSVEDIKHQSEDQAGLRFRLAVLPFLCRRTGSADDLVAESLTDMVVTRLASSTICRVVSQTSILHCRLQSVTLPELGRRLNVQRMLEGEVHRTEGRLLVTVRLYNADDNALWGDVFELGTSAAGGLEAAVSSIVARIETKCPGHECPGKEHAAQASLRQESPGLKRSRQTPIIESKPHLPGLQAPPNGSPPSLAEGPRPSI